MADRCTCSSTGELDTSCPAHGLYGDVKHPPMDRHAKVKTKRVGAHRVELEVGRETAAEVQRRLYLESAPDRIRVEAAGFRWPLRSCPMREPLVGQR